jgi:hypothetical protein
MPAHPRALAVVCFSRAAVHQTTLFAPPLRPLRYETRGEAICMSTCGESEGILSACAAGGGKRETCREFVWGLFLMAVGYAR